MQEKNIYDIIIIGSGIIGAATAYKLSLNGDYKIAVIDKEAQPNKHQTGRNSGVIHSGVYYPKGSLKSENCINGYHQLLDFLNKYELPYKITGKLIAAAEENEFKELDRLYQNAKAVGLDVRYMSKEQIRDIDPNLIPPKGFFVGETGITDYKKVCRTLIKEAKNNGVDFFFGEAINTIVSDNQHYQINGNTCLCKYIINCAGLQCDRVYTLATGQKSPVTIIPFKGEYFEVAPDLYQSDIPLYPVPNPDFPFLGVHLTRMIDGSLRIGPNAVLVFDREGYDGFQFNIPDAKKIFTNRALFNIVKRYNSTVLKELVKHGSKSFFEANVKKYWAKFDQRQIKGYTCGIRAQATEKGELLSDFRIEEFENQVHVLNAPSPAATSCLAIADTVIDRLN